MRHSLITFLMFLSISAFAQLSWDNKQLDFHPTFQETNVVARFTFSNAGNYPVAITSIKSSCDCMVPKLAKMTYLPGEKGEITANFTIGQRQGLQQKHVVLQTDDPSDPAAQLTMRVFIPELVKMTPGFLFWKIGEEKSPKTITLKIVHTEPIKIIGVQSTNERFFPQLKTVEPGKEYVIIVTPNDPADPAKALLRIETDFPKDKPRVFQAYAYIKSSAEKEGASEGAPNVSATWKSESQPPPAAGKQNTE